MYMIDLSQAAGHLRGQPAAAAAAGERAQRGALREAGAGEPLEAPEAGAAAHI